MDAMRRAAPARITRGPFEPADRAGRFRPLPVLELTHLLNEMPADPQPDAVALVPTSGGLPVPADGSPDLAPASPLGEHALNRRDVALGNQSHPKLEIALPQQVLQLLERVVTHGRFPRPPPPWWPPPEARHPSRQIRPGRPGSRHSRTGRPPQECPPLPPP